MTKDGAASGAGAGSLLDGHIPLKRDRHEVLGGAVGRGGTALTGGRGGDMVSFVGKRMGREGIP